MAEKKERLILFDAHAIIHRAYHALPDFTTSDGIPTGALYGLSNMLMKIISDFKPDYMVAAYDLPKKTFRHESYQGYKAGRKQADDDLVEQIIKSKDIFNALHIPIYEAEGFEADDILGTIVEQVVSNYKNIEIIIASGDMDTFQLIDKNNVRVFTFKKGITESALVGEEEVVSRFGFFPKFIPDFKGLAGDSSDNIPGIVGIGEKTATKIILEFKTIEQMYKTIKKDEGIFDKLGFSERIKKLIIEGEEDALFSKTLATIRRDAPIVFVLPKRFPDGHVKEKIEKLFLELQFRSLVNKVREVLDVGELNKKQEKEFLEEKFSEEDFLRTSIMAWVIDSNRTNASVEDLIMWSKTKTFKEAKEFFEKEIKKDFKNEKVWLEIEEPIIRDIVQMSENGIMVDLDYIKKLAIKYNKEISEIRDNIYRISGKNFNLDSPKQLSEVLFLDLGLKSKGKANKQGNFSTRQEVLEDLFDEHEIINQILKYRELAKMLSTYVEVIPKLVKEDGRLRALFLQHGTTTGRFSSQNPNLQNLPIKGERGTAFRKAFVAAKGNSIVAFDYSQIDLRSLAILSNDPTLVSIFENKQDIHEIVATKIFNVSKENVTKDMRRKAKTINFGIIYGMGINALKKNLGITTIEAKKFYDQYFIELPGIGNFLDSIKNLAREKGYTETLFGRKRYFKDIKSKIPFLRAFAERMATNAPIQGTSADIVKLAIRFSMEDLKGKVKSAKLILQIHDEIMFEVLDEEVFELVRIVKNSMQEVLQRSFLGLKSRVPLVVNAYAGKNLGELKDIVVK